MKLEDLYAEAGRNRGLWVGMFPDHSEDLETVKEDLIAQNSDAVLEVTRWSHVTVLHLGRNNAATTLDRVIAAVEVASSMLAGERRVGVEGFIRLPRHAGLALVPNEIVDARLLLGACLRDRAVKIDDRFAGLPHVTVFKTKYDHDVVACPGIKPFTLVFRGLTIVCGDVKAAFPFSEPVF